MYSIRNNIKTSSYHAQNIISYVLFKSELTFFCMKIYTKALFLASLTDWHDDLAQSCTCLTK